MYQIYPEFITEQEQKFIIDFILEKAYEPNTKLKSYREGHVRKGDLSCLTYAYLPIDEYVGTHKEITNIVRKIQKFLNFPAEFTDTHYGWAITLTTRNTNALEHFDLFKGVQPADKKIIRANVIAQNADLGGKFELFINGQWVVAEIPDRALMTFEASEIKHRISKNLSNKPRVNFSIDAIFDK